MRTTQVMCCSLTVINMLGFPANGTSVEASMIDLERQRQHLCHI